MVKPLCFTPAAQSPADAEAASNPGPAESGENSLDGSERRTNDRKRHRVVVAMAPLSDDRPEAFADLKFEKVRCVDQSEGGVAIVLPQRPVFSEACFFLVRKNQPLNVVAHVRSVAEAYYERRHQFRVGFQFYGIVAADGTIGPMQSG